MVQLARWCLFVAFCVGVTGQVWSQCNPVPGMQPATSEQQLGPTLFFKNIAYTLTGTPGCSPMGAGSTVTANGAICHQAYVVPASSYNCPAGTMGCSGLFAQVRITGFGGVPTNPAAHICSWTCPCGPIQTFVLNNANGLPVELLEFGIEEDGVERGGKPMPPEEGRN